MTETITSDRNSNRVFCIGCNRELFNHEADGRRVPCPICGSTRRSFIDTVEKRMQIIGGL